MSNSTKEGEMETLCGWKLRGDVMETRLMILWRGTTVPLSEDVFSRLKLLFIAFFKDFLLSSSESFVWSAIDNRKLWKSKQSLQSKDVTIWSNVFHETGSNPKRKSVRTQRNCTCVVGLFTRDRKPIFSTAHQRIPKTQEAPKIKHTIVMAYKICKPTFIISCIQHLSWGMHEHLLMLTWGTCDPWTEMQVSQGSVLWADVANGNCRWGYVCSESAMWTADQTHTWSACFFLTSPESAHDEPQPAVALQTTKGKNVCNYCIICSKTNIYFEVLGQ